MTYSQQFSTTVPDYPTDVHRAPATDSKKGLSVDGVGEQVEVMTMK